MEGAHSPPMVLLESSFSYNFVFSFIHFSVQQTNIGFSVPYTGLYVSINQVFQICCLPSCNNSISFRRLSLLDLLIFNRSVPSSFKALYVGWFPLLSSYEFPLLHTLYLLSSQQTNLEPALVPVRAGLSSISRKHSYNKNSGTSISNSCLVLQQLVTNKNG